MKALWNSHVCVQYTQSCKIQKTPKDASYLRLFKHTLYRGIYRYSPFNVSKNLFRCSL